MRLNFSVFSGEISSQQNSKNMIFTKVYLKTERSDCIQSIPVWSTKVYYNLVKYEKNCIFLFKDMIISKRPDPLYPIIESKRKKIITKVVFFTFISQNTAQRFQRYFASMKQLSCTSSRTSLVEIRISSFFHMPLSKSLQSLNATICTKSIGDHLGGALSRKLPGA